MIISDDNAKLGLSGSAAIGKQYINQPNLALQNGLLVQGSVGIGSFSAPSPGQDLLLAKLQVQGTSKVEDAAALNVTNLDNQSLFCVRNDGFVAIGTNAQSAPLVDNLPQEARDAKLYVKGQAFVGGKLFAKNVMSGTIEQISSRTLKENITNLSSQEAGEMLKQLNPVKFNYTFPGDRTLHTGFIAEDVPEILASPDHQAVRLLDVVAVLTKTVKDQREGMVFLNRVLKQQQAALAKLTEGIAALTEKVTQLENKNAGL